MSLTQIRTRLNTLRRKFAIPLAAMRLLRLADAHSQQWLIAHANHQPLPQPHHLITQLSRHHLRLPNIVTLHRYLERCHDTPTQPDPYEIARCLLPWPAQRGLLNLLPGPGP